MKVSTLKEILSIMPDDIEVFIRTNPADYSSPLSIKNIHLLEMENGAVIGNGVYERPKVLLTAFFPEKNR